MKKRTTSRRARKKTRSKPAQITVRRSSGRKEKFDKDRLASTVGRSGVPFIMAHDVAKTVTRKVRAEARGSKRKTISATRMREFITEELARRSHKAESVYKGGRAQNLTKRDINNYSKVHDRNTRAEQHKASRADADSIIHDKSKRRASLR